MPSNIFSNLIPQVYVFIPESLIFEQILLLPIKTCFCYFCLFQRIHVFSSWTFGSPERLVLFYTKVCSLKVFLCSLKVFFNGYLLMLLFNWNKKDEDPYEIISLWSQHLAAPNTSFYPLQCSSGRIFSLKFWSCDVIMKVCVYYCVSRCLKPTLRY